MANSGMYAPDGSRNVRVVDGLSKVNLYAAEGFLNVILSPGTNPAPIIHPCGAMAVSSPAVGVNRQAPDGSLNIQTTGLNAPGQFVTINV